MNQTCRWLLAFLLTLMINAPLRAQTFSKDLRDIMALQDSRSLGDGRLLSYLQSKDKRIRYRSLIALGNLQDTSTIAAIVPMLNDVDVQVRAAAAFALGQTGTLASQKALIDALTPEQDIYVLPRIFEALGKCGNAEALRSVISYIPAAKNISVKRNQALSIAGFAMRKITSERAVWLCFDLLKDNHAETRSAALYALWRSAPLGVIDVEISNRAYLLVKLMNDKESEVGINLATLLGRTKSDEAPRLLKMFNEAQVQSPEWRVQVQLARSIGFQASTDPSLAGILYSYLSNLNDHIKISALGALASLDSVTLAASNWREKILSLVKELSERPTRTAELVQGEALVTYARLFPQEFLQQRVTLAAGLKDNLLRSKYIEAISSVPSAEHLREVVHDLVDDSTRVAMAAWDFLRSMLHSSAVQSWHFDSTFIASLPSTIVESGEKELQKNDVGLTTLVATMYSDSVVYRELATAGLEPRISSDCIRAYSRLSSVNDGEAMVALQQALMRCHDTAAVFVLEKSLGDENRFVARGAAAALTSITGRSYAASSAPLTAVHTENDWKTLESIKSGQRILFKTTKGQFTIRLLKEDAPFTVLAFYRLVKARFFDGLTFHRVVPGFVVQGGDPRGDGWGGPGFVLRSEWSLATFEQGSVGIASSGKDTEGCQFFITYGETPHLDGRYTLFAYVSSGMDVVDRLQVGDKILSATVK